MSYIFPNKKGYFIYSKSNCPACDEVKKLLPDAVYVNCDKYLQDDVDEFLDHVWGLCGNIFPRTFPMVFSDGHYVGNLGDVKYLENFTLDATF
jgi:glutaredoxin